MHFQPLVLLTLSAGALALPSSLSPRGVMPNIAPYNDGDCTQKAGPSQDMLTNSKACIKINWTQDNVGVNWGSSPEAIPLFWAFTDDNCQDYASAIGRPPWGNDAKGPNSCFAMSLHGGAWRSVMQYEPPQ